MPRRAIERENSQPCLQTSAHILRSKAQEARDMTRDTFDQDFVVLLGPQYFWIYFERITWSSCQGLSASCCFRIPCIRYLSLRVSDYLPGDLDAFFVSYRFASSMGRHFSVSPDKRKMPKITSVKMKRG